MTHPLAGCWAKLRRTDANLTQLNDAIMAFFNRTPYETVTDLKIEEGEDVGEATVRARFVDPLPVEDLGVLIGEFVHNLRSSLDQLAWQLSIRAGNDPPPAGTEFPVFIDCDKFVTSGRHKIRGLSVDDRLWIEEIQPYHYGDSHPLWVLHDLSVRDKHRYALRTALEVQWPIMEPPETKDLFVLDETYPSGLPPYYEGDVIALYKVRQTGPDPKLNVKTHFTLNVLLDEGGATKGEGLFKTLLQLEEAVREIVKSFEPRFK
ncbi:MAG: hypothetical protein M3526_04550 [Actinomycetota bacterium]|nr:hypothetical protein [Actinomycetota bacterium]